jgi:hypothetical protein
MKSPSTATSVAKRAFKVPVKTSTFPWRPSSTRSA